MVRSVQVSGRHKLWSVLAVLLAILAGGAGLVWWTVAQADHQVRDDLLRQTHMLARTLKSEDIRTLTGTPEDLQKPEYLRLKKQFSAVLAAIPQCRSIYLIGRPAARAAAARPDPPQPTGEICYFVDVGTDHEARPGQAYAAASKELRRAFETGTPFVAGPHAAECGVWISGLVPLNNLRTDNALAVLGMNMDARDWNQRLLHAAQPPALLTLALAALQMLGLTLLAWRSRRADLPPRWMRYIELTLVITAGLLLTGGCTWVVCRSEACHNNMDFEQLVALRTRVVCSTMRSISSMELDSLARLWESNGESVPKNFQELSAHLEKTPTVLAWAMVPAVPVADKADFEAQARAAGAKGFEIWQKDAQGRRVPASGRDVYFPVWQVAPMAGNGPMLGYDLGSDPLCREALVAAARDGLTTASEPVNLVQETLDRKSLVIFKPARTAGEMPRLRDLAVAVLSLKSLLKSVASDDAALLEISLLRKDEPPEILAKQWESASRPSTEISAQRPVLAFGKAFNVTALVGPGFLYQRSLRNIWWSVIMGLALTTSTAIGFGTLLNRRSMLERQVTERTQEIQDSEVRFRQLAEATFEGVAIIDNGILLDGNQRFAEMHGYELAEILGRPTLDFVAPLSRHDVIKENIKFHVRRHLMHGLRKDGSIFPTEVSARLSPWLERTVIIITVRDQTEARAASITDQALRSELAHSQRLALVSEVSAGIIHQLGQPLSAIGANLAALSKLQAAKWSQCAAMKIINDVETDVTRMRDIVNHLRALTNPSQTTPEYHDLNALVAKVKPLLQAKAELARTRLDLDLHHSLPAIRADAIQISQVILNLMRNAIDASADVAPERRVILITTRPHAEHGVELCVRDYGSGIHPEASARMFKPFFTTKPNGMGVGLRLCQTIVHAHDGHIDGFNNADGHGATFRIQLPLKPRFG
ncbi:MAG: CHASE domain-containing protein [Verrucomicrobiota bacterium]